ncbi:hypothetical protein [Streptosporangium sp. NPDC004631]
METRALVAVVAHRAAAAAGVYDELVAASLSDVIALLKEGQRNGELRVFGGPGSNEEISNEVASDLR